MDSPSLPNIVNGMDLESIVGVIAPHVTKMFEALRAGRPTKELNQEEIDKEVARLPNEPDEKLR